MTAPSGQEYGDATCAAAAEQPVIIPTLDLFNEPLTKEVQGDNVNKYEGIDFHKPGVHYFRGKVEDRRRHNDLRCWELGLIRTLWRLLSTVPKNNQIKHINLQFCTSGAPCPRIVWRYPKITHKVNRMAKEKFKAKDVNELNKGMGKVIEARNGRFKLVGARVITAEQYITKINEMPFC